MREALEHLDPLWEELLPAEQARIVRLLVERVEVGPDGADIRLRIAGLTGLMAAAQLRHSGIGIEIDRDYAKTAVSRLLA